MIIVRSPLRVSLGGGGTDLASYYRDNEGFLLTAAIDVNSSGAEVAIDTMVNPTTTPGTPIDFAKFEQ